MKKYNTKVTECFDLEPGEFVKFAEQNFVSVEVHTREVNEKNPLNLRDAFAPVPFSFSSSDILKDVGIFGEMKLAIEMKDFTITNNNEFPIRVVITYETTE